MVLNKVSVIASCKEAILYYHKLYKELRLFPKLKYTLIFVCNSDGTYKVGALIEALQDEGEDWDFLISKALNLYTNTNYEKN